MKKIIFSLLFVLTVLVLLSTSVLGVFVIEVNITGGTGGSVAQWGREGDNTKHENAVNFSISATGDIHGFAFEQVSSSGTCILYAQVETDSSGDPSGTLADVDAKVAVATSGATVGWQNHSWPGAVTLTLNTQYWLTMQQNASCGAGDQIAVRLRDSGVANHRWERSIDDGSWTDQSSSDLRFIIFSNSTGDTIFPQFNTNGTNSTDVKKSDHLLMFANLTDDTSVDDYIFGFDNGNGVFVNDTVVSVGAVSSNVSTNKIITARKDATIRWRWHFNDSSGNGNQTDIFTVTINNSRPIVTLNSPADQTQSEFQLIANFTVTDGDGDPMNITLFINGTINATNTTSLPNGTTETINATSMGLPNKHFQWIIQACDNSSQCTNSTARTYIHVDTTLPQYNTNGSNQTDVKKNDHLLMFVNLTDDTLVDDYIFGFDDGSGTFVNDTVVSVALISSNVSVSKIITSNKNKILRWRWHFNDSSGNGNQTDIFTVTINNSRPIVVINSPADNDKNNIQLIANFTVTDLDGDPMNITLFINGTINATNTTSLLNGTTETINSTSLNNQHYSWIIQACDNSSRCTNSTARTYVHDDTNPILTWLSPFAVHSTSNQNLTTSVLVTDTNLFRVNYSVFYSNNSLFYNNFSGNLSAGTSAHSVNDTIGFTSEGNYSLNISATDSHTFNLDGMSYNLDKKGITFTRHGILQKRLWFGYYASNQYRFLTDTVIDNYNISSGLEVIDKEYSWYMNYKKPAQSVIFFFALEKTPDLILVDADIGHFVSIYGMDGFYFDFSDVIASGYPITVVEKTVNSKDYWVIYSSTSYCSSQVGKMCKI